MDAMSNEPLILERWEMTKEPGQVVRPKTLLIGVGGTGVLVVTYLAACMPDDAPIGVLALDVMSEPPAVIVKSDENDGVHRLEMKREYVPIGRDLDPPHLSRMLRERRGDEALRELLAKQPGGRFVKSVEIGTEGERIYGYLALLWSQREVEQALRRSLRRLNDITARDGAGEMMRDMPVNVVIVGSTAGGVGSAIVLPVCGLVKQAMDRLGIGTQRSLFTYVAVGAEAFDETQQQLSNSFESLTDVAIAQGEALTPCPRL